MFARKDVAGRDRVDANPGWRQLVRQTDREADDAGLGHRVRQQAIDVAGKSSPQRQSGDRSDEDDRTAAARLEVRNRILGDQELYAERVVEGPAPVGQRGLLDGPGAVAACAVKQDIDAAEAIRGELREPAYALLVHQIERVHRLHRSAPGPYQIDGRLPCFRIEIATDNRYTSGR